MDYKIMLDYHKANNADITIACNAGSDGRSEPFWYRGNR